MYSERTDDMQRGERKPFEPTPIELRKQYLTLDSIIRIRSGRLKDELTQEIKNEFNENDADDAGFLPPYNSAF